MSFLSPVSSSASMIPQGGPTLEFRKTKLQTSQGTTIGRNRTELTFNYLDDTFHGTINPSPNLYEHPCQGRKVLRADCGSSSTTQRPTPFLRSPLARSRLPHCVCLSNFSPPSFEGPRRDLFHRNLTPLPPTSYTCPSTPSQCDRFHVTEGLVALGFVTRVCFHP